MFGFEGGVVKIELGEEESRQLKQMALDRESTLYLVLLTLYITLLSKISGQEDLVVGIVTTGRGHADLEPMIGSFINTMAFRSQPTPELAFTDLLRRVKEKALTAFENQDYQFEDLVEKMNRRWGNRNPLFDVIFGFLNMEDPSGDIHVPGLTFTPYQYTVGRSRFDLVFLGREAGDKLVFTLEYSTKLFKEETVQKFVRYFRNIVTGVLADPGVPLKAIEMLSDEEKEAIYAHIDRCREEIGIEFDMEE